MIWTHVSTEIEYREPLGAMRAGGELRLSLLAVPEYEGESGEYEVALLLQEPQGSWQEHPMTPKKAMESDCFFVKQEQRNPNSVLWSCGLTLEQVGVHWYYFRIRQGGNLFFYGAAYGKNSGKGEAIQGMPTCYQLTVYEADFETPEWFRRATMYQIFPDRYQRGRMENLENGIWYHREKGRKVYAHDNWEEIPYYRAMQGEEYYYPSDFFGGDLEGICQNLDELRDMGITCLYLNPIVEADSNHRYNTSDYKKVDPILGTEEDFQRLCMEAEKRGIRIMLDGVYSHTGSDSIYFNKNGNYPEPGAYQWEESPYDSWYSFEGDKNHYKSWWGFESLPEVNELDPSWQEYVVTGEDSVFRYWLDLGAGGIRLDVADELPDEVIALMRIVTKQTNADKVLLGEVWEDATLKESYGSKRTYALGKGLDSVMNYPFRNMTIAWLTGWSTAGFVAEFMQAQQANYPQPMYGALMNLLSSHDVARLRTVLATGTEGKDMSREEQADYILTYKQERHAARLSRLAMGLQFVIPGVPSVYYGDEYGMCGFNDPFNRGTMERRDKELAEFVRSISLLRREEKVLQTGAMSTHAYGDRVLAVLRLANETEMTEEDRAVFLTVFNSSGDEQDIHVSLADFTEGLSKRERLWLNEFRTNRENKPDKDTAKVLLTAEKDGEDRLLFCESDEIKMHLAAYDMMILKLLA